MEPRAVGIGPRIVDLLSALLRLKLRWMILLWPWFVDHDAGGWKSPRLVAETYIHTDDSGERATAEIGKNWSSPLRVVK